MKMLDQSCAAGAGNHIPNAAKLANSERRGHGHVTAAYPALETVTRPTVETAAAAYYLNRKPQTMRWWAMREDGPIRPLRINGRLAWPVARIKELVGVA